MNKDRKISVAGVLIFMTLAIFFNASCSKNATLRSVDEEKLFSLNYGTFEDELELFSLNNYGAINTKIAMKDGFFFVADDYAKKIMQFTSFGDLTGIIYNPKTNPEPSFIRKIGKDENDSNIKSATQSAEKYNFNSIEQIVLDSYKNIYVVDQINSERQEVDPKTNLILREIVVKFSNDGKNLFYYGQEGIGGTPFSFIKDIFITENDELVVVSMDTEGYIIFWFNKNGSLHWKIPIQDSYIPVQNEEYFISIDKIVPDYFQKMLYIKADYFKASVDSELNVQSGIEYVKTLLHQFNIEKNEFDNPIEIPAYDDVIVDRFTKLIFKTPYDFLGVTSSGAFFFAVPDDNGLVLQIMQKSNQKITKRHIDYNIKSAVFTNFSLSEDGIISALIANQNCADVFWWRTDSLVDKR